MTTGDANRFHLRAAHAQVSLVRVNGDVTPVYYNDGDTWRALGGRYRNRAARLAGYNTLESYGPVHQWGGWTFRELYVNAKQATLHARRRMWNCDVDAAKVDTFGRILADCADLRNSQVRRGLAHIYNIGQPSDRVDILAQREAMMRRRGMWAKGVPAVVLTSLHSADERFDNSRNYNRLISSLDGLSAKWKHQETYEECEEVCHRHQEVPRDEALRIIGALRADPTTTDVVAGYEDPYLMVLLNEYMTPLPRPDEDIEYPAHRVAHIFADDDGRKAVQAKLDRLRQARQIRSREVKGACMIYAKFRRRYTVKPKPACLKL
ncbi:MAG: hypothetical protein AAGN82_24610 [Myxococcota bacterium]